MAYQTAAAIKALVPRLATESDATIDRHVAVFEELAERYLGVAYNARSGVTYTDTPKRGWIELPHVEVTAIASIVDEDATAYTQTRLDTRQGRVEVAATLPLTVTYTHGFTAPSDLLAQACTTYVARRVAADNSGQSRDVLSQNFDGGTTRYATPDWSMMRPTGFLDVDADLNAMPSRRLQVF